MKFIRRWSTTADEGESLSYLDACETPGLGAEAPVVVFLHGLAGSANELRDSADAIGTGFRSVLIDLPGHGRSTRHPVDLSRTAFVRAVVTVIESVSRGSLVTLVGQSMGAHTAMLVAAKAPQLLGRLVLLECTAEGADRDSAAKLGGYLRSWPVPFPDSEIAMDFLGRSGLAHAWIADLESGADGLRPRFDPAVMESVLHTLEEPRWAEWIGTLTRTTAIFGANGMFGEQQQREFVDARPGVARVSLTSGGHDAHLDAPDEWHRALIRVLREAPSDGSARGNGGGTRVGGTKTPPERAQPAVSPP